MTNEGELQLKRQEMDKAKVADAVKWYSYLLRQTKLFKHCVDIKKVHNLEYAAMLNAQPKPKGRRRGRKKARWGSSAEGGCVHAGVGISITHCREVLDGRIYGSGHNGGGEAPLLRVHYPSRQDVPAPLVLVSGVRHYKEDIGMLVLESLPCIAWLGLGDK
ncbi:hypothetical protein BDQ17DRAFT_1490116 [Cyathus striatus]|nr:hypothetical protein BDQ17DRAFT_1490116 [Cyathus striatus]